MAQTLLEDHSYNLTQLENEEKRHVYFVKLTDSCLKAIEEHLAFKAATRTKPAIKFEGQNGVISIPSKPGSASQDVEKKFHFSVSNLKSSESNPLQGILECIKHPDRKTSKLVSYGALDSKISIAATDDVYENTRNRMAQVDQERKDVRTKEIKLGSMKKGKQAKAKVITPDSYKMAAMKKKLSSQHQVSKSPKPSVLPPSSNNHSSPVSTSNRSSPVGKSFTCRERVIHILALRSHKKPELISRLQREAMSQKDRNNLAMVLQQVSSLQDNQYKLQSHLYSDVQVDTWPFYSESERLAVKRNIATRQKPKTSSPQIVSSTSKSPEEKPALKRPPAADSNVSVKRPKFESDEPTSTSSITSTRKPTKANTPKTNNNNPVAVKPEKKQKLKYGEESPPKVASTSDTPEYLTSYKPITTYEQRCLYKRDFQSEYPEYLQLKKNVDSVTTKFIELDRSWRWTEKDSPEYLRIQDEIVDAYQKQQKDEEYHEMKRRCEELHQKLSHIKRLVMEYDNNAMMMIT